jgi:DNA-binding response OmpR family regulator
LDAVHYDSGSAAFEAALAETPDLVILDVKMPGMDGFEVLERLRRTPAYRAIPIIMLTSMGSEADVVRGFSLGADDYILKPFSPTELSARVRRLLRRGRSATAL